MSLKNLFRKLSLLLVTLTFLGGSVLATDIYVNNTNGDDLLGDGTQGNPYKTITKALDVAVDGDVLYIAGDVYNSENDPLVFDVDVTVIVETFQGRTDALVSGSEIEIDADVSIAATGTNDFRFDDDLTLTSGTLTTVTANFFALADPVLVTVVDGSIVGTPDYAGEVDVTYNHTVARANSDELPSNLNGGTITNAPSGAFALTINKAVTAGQLTNSATRTVIFTAAPTFEGDVVAILNNAGGLVDFQAGATVEDDVTNTGATIQLNDQTLTTVGPVAFLNIGGEVISDASQTVGDGLVYVTGAGAVTVDGGEFPNLELPSAFTGTFTLNGDLALYGDFLLSAAQPGAFTDGGNDLQMYGDFVRDEDTPGNYVATGTLSFLGGQDQLFDPGASLVLNNVYVDNNNGGATSYVVTMDASVEVEGNFTIEADGLVELDIYHIRMNAVAGATFSNDGQYVSSPGTGYVIFEGGSSDNLTGSGIFSNIDIRNNTTVTAQSDINFSGILRMRKGLLDYNGNTWYITSDLLTTPHFYVYTDAGDIRKTGGDLSRHTGATTLYNLTFLETTDRTVDGEWTATSGLLLNNVSVNTTTGAVISGVLADGTIHGVLDVDGTEFLDLGGFTYALTGDGPAGGGLNHTIAGRVQNGELSVQDDGSSITGSNDDAHQSAVDFLTIDLAAGETFTSTLLQEITGDLVHNNGTSTIQMTDDDAVLPNGPTFSGDLVLNDGTLTFGMTDNGHDIVGGGGFGGVDLNDGILILGSDLDSQNPTVQTDAEIQLNGNTYEASDLYTHDGTGKITGTTGWFHVTYDAGPVANDDFTLTTPLSVSNFMFEGAVEVDLVTDDLTVTNLYEHTSGAFDLNGNDLIFSGTDFEYVAGTLNDELGGSTLAFTGTTQNLNLNADFTLGGVGALDFELDQTASQLNIVDVAAAGGPWQFIITGQFTMTNGDIELNTNDLVAQGDWTRVAGNITGGGFFVLDGGNAYDQGPATFNVDRLRVVNGPATFQDDQPWQINVFLQLADDLFTGDGNSATAAHDPQLTFADDVTVERQNNGATLGNTALYVGGINIWYTTAGPIETSDEASATTIYDFLAQVVVQADRDFTVRDMITIDQRNGAAAGQLDSDINDADANGDDVVSLADNGWVTLIDVGGPGAFVDPLNPLGVINVKYDNSVGPLSTSNSELDPLFDIGQVVIDGDDDADDIYTHVDLRLGGNLQILDSGDFDINNHDLHLAGGYTQASDGTIVNRGGTTSDVRLVGDADWTFDAGGQLFVIGDDGSVEDVRNYTFGVNTDDADVQVTLANGNLDFAQFGQTLYLEQGMITTGDNIVILEQHSDANLEQGSLSTQPTQGFVRTGDSHVVGNVRKYLGHQDGDANVDNSGDYVASIALTRVEFPVGAPPTSPSAYRPFALSFNTLPTASTNVTVNHIDARPAGENGMPISTTEGFTITNFSDFYWTMKSDITLQPQVKYDVEARAEGYRDQYEPEEVEDIRFVRRFANNVDNPWILQGSTGYDNSTDEQGAGIDDDMAVVIAKDAVGAVSSQGALFAYSQNNKAPFFTASLPDTTIAENDLLEFTYVINDPDIDDEGTMAAVSLPDSATFDPETGKFSWQTGYYDAGTHQVIISATDTYGGTRYDTAAVTVTNLNRPIAIDYTADSGDTVFVGEGDQLSLQFTYTDADTNDTPTFAVTNWTGTADSSFNTATGLFNFTPAFGEVGMVYQLDVQVADGAGSIDDTTAYVAVVKTNRAPMLALVNPADTTAEVDEGDLLEVLYTASDADGDALTYSVVEENGDSTGAAMVDSMFTWTPAFTQAGVYNFWVIVTDDGAPNKSDSLALVVTVNDVNAPPVFTVTPPADTTIAVGETFTFQYEAEDPDEDVLTFAFADEYPDNATLDSETGVFTWTPQETAIWAIRLKVSDPSGLYDSTSSLIKAQEFTVTVSGNVTYNNADSAAIENAVVAVNGESDSTDANGNYLITDVRSGTYTVTATKTGDTGGILASDALKAALFVLDSAKYPLNDLAQLAADVNNSGGVTGADAQLILQRVVDDSVAFNRGDWVFTSEEITLVSTDVTANLSGMVVGDVNGSYMSTIALAKEGKAKQNNVTATYAENIRISAEQEFEVPVSYSGSLKAGAVTLQFSYPQEKLEFVSVKAPVNFVYKENDGVITLAWADLTGKNPLIVEDSPLLIFTFKATDQLAKQEVVNLTLENKSEISGTDGEVYKSSSISIPGIEQAIPKEFALSQNYPNPFNPSTVINYDLPVNGEVKLIIYNMLGQEVTKLVNAKQEAGSYKVSWNAGNFASGVYIYRITVEGVKNFVQTKKMILVK